MFQVQVIAGLKAAVAVALVAASAASSAFSVAPGVWDGGGPRSVPCDLQLYPFCVDTPPCIHWERECERSFPRHYPCFGQYPQTVCSL